MASAAPGPPDRPPPPPAVRLRNVDEVLLPIDTATMLRGTVGLPTTPTAHADVLAAGAVETYSVLVGEDQPYHLWLIDSPAAAPLVVPPDRRGGTVVLQGEARDAAIE